MFFVVKSLVKLYFERKQKVLGYKFKTKLVVTLVVLTLIPTAFLFLVSSGLITRYIDRMFAPQVKQPLNSSIEIAKTVYEIERQKTLDYAKTFMQGSGISEHTVSAVFLRYRQMRTETMKSAFEGKEGSEVISGRKGDIVQAVLPEFRRGRQIGVIVVESFIPAEITENVENIKNAYENYLALESWKVL